ncbi:MAG TPA: hypothetical protein PKD85_02960 [Saprospiraceae bacterium]|nr:hypothetical protein [Saprospiraceae bacterium]
MIHDSAINTINTEDKYHVLLQYILNNTYIFIGNIDQINNLDLPHNAVILSSNGSYFKTVATLSGGAVGLFEGKKIGRKKSLEKLEKLLRDLQSKKIGTQEQLDGIKKEIDLLKNNDMRKVIDEANINFAKTNQELVKLSLEIESIEKTRTQTRQKIEINKKSIEEFKTSIQELNQNLENLQLQLRQLTKPNEDQNDTLDNISEILNKASEKYNTLNIEHIKQQNLLNSVSKDLEYKQIRIKEITQRQTLERNKLEREKEEYFEAAEKLVVLDRKLSALYKEKSGFQGELSSTEQAYHQARVLITDKEEKARGLTRQSNQLQITINQQKERYNEIKYEISAVGDRLNIEFGVPVNDIINLTPDETIPREEELDKANTELW